MTKEITVYEPGGRGVIKFTDDEIDLIRNTYGAGTTDAQFNLFLSVAQARGLDPRANQIHPVVRKSRQKNANGRWEEVSKLIIQTGIDGYRLISERSGEFEGMDGPYWCGPDGVWQDVWLSPDAPMAAKVTIHRRGHVVPTTKVCLYSEFVQQVKEYKGSGDNRVETGRMIPNEVWAKSPSNQLAKCAEAGARRAAFPEDLSGIYVPEEMGIADHVWAAEKQASENEPRKIKPPKSKSQRAIEAPAAVDEETGEIADEEPIEGEVVEAPEPAPEKPKSFTERNGPPFGGESEDPPAPKRAVKPKAAPAEEPEAEGDLNTWPAFYNAITGVMKPLGRDFGDLGMVLNCPGNLVGVKEWFADNEGKITDRYTHAHRALIGLE